MSFGPVVMSVAGDTFTESTRILAIIWSAQTESGYTVEVVCPKTGRLLWEARTSDTQTYCGINVGVEGIPAPYGFKLSKISSGRILVYLREN